MILILIVCSSPVLAVELNSSTDVATSGYYTLSWETPEAGVELQESGDPGFSDARTLYRGHDSATLISGRQDGDWYYRLRPLDQDDWSEPAKVTVSHHGLGQAFGFLGIGLIVFLATVILIVHGTTREKRS